MTTTLHDSLPPGARERLREEGPERLSDAELVSLVLGTGTAREPVAVLAARLVDEAGGLARLARLGTGALARASGVGATKAARLVAAVELGRRAARRSAEPSPRIGSSADVVSWIGPRLAEEDVEHFVALALDARQRVIALLPIARGSLTACPIAPADVFRALLREAAAATVLAHNHPSGDPSPSTEDLVLTERMVSAGSLLGIRVLDHVIVGRTGHFSFLDAGLLRAPVSVTDRASEARPGRPSRS